MTRATTRSAHSVEHIWGLMADVERWGELLPTVASVRRLGGPAGPPHPLIERWQKHGMPPQHPRHTSHFPSLDAGERRRGGGAGGGTRALERAGAG